ncbi:MAG: M28 family peptidase, partial [Chloroflexota bacterium]|nr:M28 family peptidase [Chloroflexota bacterium]
GVAVLLGLCREIKRIQAPVRVVFFDREEAWFRTPLLRLGLLGSLYYVWRNDLRQLAAVYNLEYCGRGELLGVWPVRPREVDLAAVREVAEAAARLALPFQTVHIPWPLLSSDHLSFRLKGMANAITLSLLPQSQVPALENLLTGVSIPRLLTGRRPVLPEPLLIVHTPGDNSSRLSESSLQLMLSLVLELIEGYRLASSRITSR